MAPYWQPLLTVWANWEREILNLFNVNGASCGRLTNAYTEWVKVPERRSVVWGGDPPDHLYDYADAFLFDDLQQFGCCAARVFVCCRSLPLLHRGDGDIK